MAATPYTSAAEARRDGLSGCRSPTPTCARQAGHLAKRHSAASLSGHACLEPHPPHTATTPTTAKAGLHSPRHDHLAGQSRVKTPPPRPLPRREVLVGMSYSLLWPPSEPTFSQTGSLGNVGGNRIPAMAQCHRTKFGQAPECTTCVLLYNDLTPPCGSPAAATYYVVDAGDAAYATSTGANDLRRIVCR